MSNIYPDGIDVAAEVEEFVRNNANGPVSKKGSEYVLEICPFCKGGKKKEKNKFYINIKTGRFQCKRFSCGVKGNLWTLSKDPNINYSLPEPEKKDEKKVRPQIKSFKSFTDRDERAAKWVKENRGIPEEITYKYKLAFNADKFAEFYKQNGDDLVWNPDDLLVWQFTNAKGDKTLWCKFRNIGKVKDKEISLNKDIVKIGKDGKAYNYHTEPCLFGMGECDYKTSEVIMTEGQFDTLAVATAGYGNVVSVPTGADGFAWYKNSPDSYDFLQRFETLIIFGDKEKDGTITLLDGMLAKFNGRVKCVRVEDYKDCKDANDILRKYGVEQIRACIENAEEIPIKRLKKMKDIKRVNMSELPRIKTGLPTLDKYLLGFFFGQVITVTGRSGDGKTTLTSQFAAYAIEQDIPVVIYSGEFSDWNVKQWMVLQLAGPDNLEVTAAGIDVKKEIYDQIEAWNPFGEQCHVYSVDDLDINNNEDDGKALLETIKEAIRRAGKKFIVIDNLMTAMSFSDDADLNKVQSLFMKQIKYIAKTYEVIIIIVAHPKKALRGSNEITREDIAGSSNIGNLSDTIISYSRPETKNGKEPPNYERELKVLKNRWNNDKGVAEKAIPLYFNETSKRIAETKVFDWSFEWEDFKEPKEDDDIPFK